MRIFGLLAAALMSVLAASPASAAVKLLDNFTNAVTPDGVFTGIATRSNLGNGVTIATGAGEARLVADNLDTPTFSGLVYDFSPHQAVLSKVTVTARNRQTSVTETGTLTVKATTSAGTFTLTQTLPGATATMQNYDFDFSSLAGPGMTLQKLDVVWDIPSGGTGLRGLAIDKIDLYEVPEPATIALIGLASSCGGVVGYRRRKKAVAKKV